MEIHDPLSAVAQLLPTPKPAGPGAARLHLLVRTAEQLDAAIALAPASITLDYLDLYGLRPSLERVKAAGIEARVASPRVLKPGEQRIADFLLRCESPILVRSAGLLETLRAAGVRLDGDFSLNAANAISAGHAARDGTRPRHAHARPERRADRRTGPTASIRSGWRSSPISTCPCSTPSTASSAASFPPAPAIAIAAARARSTGSRCAIPAAARIR